MISYTKGVRMIKAGDNIQANREKGKARKIRVTGWFKAQQKPARPGIYERRFKQGLIMYSKWDGHFWAVGDESLWRATHRVEVSAQQSRPWRGVVKK